MFLSFHDILFCVILVSSFKVFNSFCHLQLPLVSYYDLKCFGLMIFFEWFLWCQLEAAAVNLVAGEKPADVYSEIAVRYTILKKEEEVISSITC